MKLMKTGRQGLINSIRRVIASASSLADFLAFQANASTGLGLATGTATPTYTRATEATFTDANGMVRTLPAGVPAMEGAEFFVNEFTFAASDANYHQPETVYGTSYLTTWGDYVTDPDGGTNAQTLTASGSGYSVVTGAAGALVTNGSSIADGDTVQHVVWLKRRTGTGDIKLYQGEGFNLTTVEVTSEWKLFAGEAIAYTAAPDGADRIGIYIVTSGDEVDVAFPMFVNMTGRPYSAPPSPVPFGVGVGDELLTTAVVYTDWTGLGTNGVTDGGDGSTLVTYVDNGAGAELDIGNLLPVLESTARYYVIQGRAKMNTGSANVLMIEETPSIAQLITSTSYEYFHFSGWLYDGGGDLKISFNSLSAGETINIFIDSVKAASMHLGSDDGGSMYIGSTPAAPGAGLARWNANIMGPDLESNVVIEATGVDASPDKYVYFDGTSSNKVSTPDTAAIRPTGDVTLKWAMMMPDVTPAALQVISLNGAGSPTASINMYLYMNTAGKFIFSRPTGSTVRVYTSSVAVDTVMGPGQLMHFKCDFDEDNGSSLSEVNYYYSSTGEDGTWTAFGTALTAALGTGNSGTTGFRLGSSNTDTFPFTGRIYSFKLYDGIDGTLVQDIDLASAVAGTAAWVSAVDGLTYTPSGVDAIVKERPSSVAVGEVITSANSKFANFVKTAGISTTVTSPSSDFTIIAYIAAEDYTSAADMNILGHNTVDYELRVNTAGNLILYIEGTSAASDAPGFVNGVGYWVRASWDDSADEVTYYKSEEHHTIAYTDVTWTQIGAVKALVSTITPTAAATHVGNRSGSILQFYGRIYSAYLLSGVLPSDTVVLSFDANDWESGATFVSSVSGETWTINGNAYIYTPPVDAVSNNGYTPWPAITNLITHSHELNDGSWTKAGVTVDSDAVIAPDGTLTADRINIDAGGTVHVDVVSAGSAASTTVNTDYCASVYIKDDGIRYIGLRMFWAPDDWVALTIDMDTDAIDAEAGSGTATLTDSGIDQQCPDGYKRVYIVGQDSVNTSIQVGVDGCSSATPTRSGSGWESFTGVDGEDFIAWGAQLVEGTYPAPYVPTSGGSATRNADVLSYTPPVTTGPVTMVIDIVAGSDEINDLTPNYLVLSDGGNDYMRLYTASSNVDVAQSVDSAVQQAQLTVASLSEGTGMRLAAVFDTNDVRFYRDGSEVGADTSGTLPTGMTLLAVGNSASNVSQVCVPIKNVRIYNKALTAAEVATL